MRRRTEQRSKRRGVRESWVRPYLKRYGGALAAAVLISVLAYLFAAGLMFTSGYMISLAAALPLTVLVLHLPSIFVRIFGIGKPLLGYSERLISHNWVLRMTSEMRRRLYDALERKGSALRSADTLGGILALLTEDIGHVQDLFLKSVIPLATSWLAALLLVVCAGLFSVQLGLLFLTTLAVILVALPLFSIAANAARLARRASLKAELYEKLTDDVEGLADWVLSGNDEGYAEDAARLRSQRRLIDTRIRRYGRRHDLLVQVFFGACIAMLTLWACLVFGGAQSDAGLSLSTGLAQALGNVGSDNAPAYAPNWIAAFVLCIFPLLDAFATTSHAAMELKDRKAALARMSSFSRTETCDTAQRAGYGAAARDGAPVMPAIDMRGLCFSYPESDKEVLYNVNLHIPYGEHIAVLGRSGAGKTTLAAILHGDRTPTGGTCTVGGLVPSDAGTDAAGVVGVVSQDPYIFNLTLRDNLKLADPCATDSELREVLAAVGLYERFKKLPHGLDSVIESHARNLSGGEAQRIAVARILLADQPIVLLDEPFAGLDRKTERALLETILHVLGDRTLIAITHHLENIEMFDRVVFIQGTTHMSEGATEASSIAFSGTPEELAENERYKKLLELSDSGQGQSGQSHVVR